VVVTVVVVVVLVVVSALVGVAAAASMAVWFVGLVAVGGFAVSLARVPLRLLFLLF